MKKPVKIFFLLVIFSLLGGCSRTFSQNQFATHVVTEITVTCETCEDFTQRYYASPEKVRAILLCIRKLGPDFPAQTDVDAIPGKTLSITLGCTDGSRVTYRIRNNQFIQKNGGTWRRINQKNALGFYQLILGIDSDPEQRTRWDLLPASAARRVYFPATDHP